MQKHAIMTTVANQNILDLVLQNRGTLNEIANFLKMNDLSITSEIASNSKLKFEVVKNDVIDYYQRKGISIATGFGKELINNNEGTGGADYGIPSGFPFNF